MLSVVSSVQHLTQSCTLSFACQMLDACSLRCQPFQAGRHMSHAVQSNFIAGSVCPAQLTPVVFYVMVMSLFPDCCYITNGGGTEAACRPGGLRDGWGGGGAGRC